MKIKTILTNTDNIESFDAEVNDALEKGWMLAKREVLPGVQYNANNWARRALYAELTMLDPAPEPDTVAMCDPLDLVLQLREFCDSVPRSACQDRTCPLARYCGAMIDGKDISEWPLPKGAQHGTE